MKKAALFAFLLACLALHTRPAWAVTPGVASTGVVIRLTSPVTGSPNAQSVSVGSNLGCAVGGYVEVRDSSPEISPIFSLPSNTQINAIFRNNHSANADVVCSLSVSAVNRLYGWATSGINDAGTTAVQVGPNPSPTQSMYVQGVLTATAADTLTFSLGSGGCTTISTLFAVNLGAGTPFNFSFVVPPNNYLCLTQSASSTTAEGYVNALQE